MAATATEQPVLDRLTVLASGGEHGKEAAFMGNRGEKSVDVAAKLRNVRPAGGKETMRAGLAIKEGETKYNWRNSKAFLDRFGSGKKLTEMSASERASYMKARDVLQTNTIISLFLEAKGLPDNPPAIRDAFLMTNKTAIKEVTGVANPNYNLIRTVALKLIVSDSSFKAMFPELQTSAMNEASMMAFTEKTLFPAEDQRMAARLGTRMQEAYKQSLQLTEVVTDEDRETYRREQNNGKLTLEQKAKQIADFLDSKGILSASSKKYKDTEVVSWITSSGASPDGTIDSVLEKALGSTHQEFSEMVQFKDAEINMPTLKASFNAKHLAGPYGGSAFDIGGYLAGNPTDVDVIKYKQHDVAYKKGLPNYGAAVGAIAAGGKRALYVQFDNVFSPLLKDPGLQTLAKEAKEAQVKMNSMDIKLKGLPVITAGEEKLQFTRIVEEEDLCGLMDGILGQSIADVLEERYDVMEERQGRLMEQNAKKADQDVAKLILELKKKMSKNWIGFDATTHKRTIDKKTIKKDVVHLTFSADKDMALKQLIARDLFGIGNYDRLNVVDGTDGAGSVLLDETKMGQLNKIFESSGQAYRDKLWADMFAARGFMDKQFKFLGIEFGSTGQLGFKSVEMQEMVRLYQPEIMKGIEGNREAAQAMKNLEAQGVQFNHPMKWLYYLLAVVFGLGAGAIAMPAGIAAGSSALSSVAAGTFSPLAAETIAGAAAGGLGGAAVVNKFSEN